jgi:hypothetical protein
MPNTTESDAYNRIPDSVCERQTVCHSQSVYARDEEQDGCCEIHCNTIEGIWVGVRNFLRPFRDIHKKYLYLYVAMFEWSYNLRWIDLTSSAVFFSLLSPIYPHERKSKQLIL